METLVPLIGYSRAATADGYHADDQRENDSRLRHWALVWWEDVAGLHTAEFMVITESMPDFCGGVLVYSPKVEVYDKCNSWSSGFASPGMPGDNETVDCAWEIFDPKIHAIDLAAFTGQDSWDASKVRTYGWRCIMAKLGGTMHSLGKRGFMAADWERGQMTRLVEAMMTTGSFLSTPHYGTDVSSIGLDRCGDRSMGALRGYEMEFQCEVGDEWYNSNSGNQVHWLTGLTRFVNADNCDGTVCCPSCDHDFNASNNDWECPQCGYYLSDEEACEPMGKEHTLAVPGACLDVLQSYEYRQRARRYIWRNG